MQEQPEKYYIKLDKLESLHVKNFPNEFPMFLKATSSSIAKYNALMVKCSSNGFDPRARKVCFTLMCEEGLTHEDVFNIAKDLPEVSEEYYNNLKDIPHWDPIESATKVLENYMHLIEVVDESQDVKQLAEIVQEAYIKERAEAAISLQ